MNRSHSSPLCVTLFDAPLFIPLHHWRHIQYVFVCVSTSLLICKINNFAFDFNSPEQYMHRYSEQKQNQIILLWVVYCMQKKHQDCVLNCVSDPFSTHQNKHMKSVNYKLIVCAPRIFVLNCQPHTHYNIFLHSSSNFSLPPILLSLCLFVSFGPLLWCSLLLLPFAFPFFLSFSRCCTTYLRFWSNFPIYAYVSLGYPNIEYIVTRSIQMQIAFTHCVYDSHTIFCFCSYSSILFIYSVRSCLLLNLPQQL